MLFSPQLGVNSISFFWYHSIGSLSQELLCCFLCFLVGSRCYHSGNTMQWSAYLEFHRENVSYLISNLRLMEESSTSCPRIIWKKQNHRLCKTLTKAIKAGQEEAMEEGLWPCWLLCTELWASTDLGRQSRWCKGAGQSCTNMSRLAGCLWSYCFLLLIYIFLIWHRDWATCTWSGLS